MVCIEEKKLYTPENYRELIKDEDGVLYIDETQLDIFSYYKKPIPDWEPTRSVKPYSELSQVHLDIETQGLDPNIHKILLIGLNNERNMRVMINAYDDERGAILKLFEILENKKPDILNVFRGFQFDLPFIIRRCEILRIVHPFTVSDKLKVFKTAQKHSKAESYYPVYLSYSQGWGTPRHQVAIIDSYHQVLAWDFVARVMTEHNLKAAPVQMGLTDRERVTLSYKEMQECEKRGDWETFRKYLDYDLTDTKLLGDALIPPLYYQKLFLDWKFQSISTAGNGSKWQSILADQYPEYYLPEADEKRKFKGALTIAFAGFFGKNGITQDYECTKFDVTSLYPTSMLLWGIHSKKDIQAFLLMILKYMRAKRIELKAISYTDKEADRMQAMLKILINSGYGQFGTTGIGFNDYEAAALVTAYGRAVFRHCIKLIRQWGGKILTCDTDGFFVMHKKGEAETLRKYLQERMPGNDLRIKISDDEYDPERDKEIFFINLEAELTAKAVYIPLADRKVKLDETLVDENDEGLVRAGLKKNYIIVHTDKTAAKIAKKRKRSKPIVRDKLKFNGKYRKRDRCILEKQFPVLLINLLVNHGELAARSYYRGVKKQIVEGTLPKKLIQITRKIKKGEKTLVNLGVGQIGEIVTIYRSIDLNTYSEKTGKLLTKKIPTWTKNGQCNWDFYLKIIEDQFKEIMEFWNPQRHEQLNFIEQKELAFV